MKKKLLLLHILFLLFGALMAQQQNTKIVFPHPAGYNQSDGLFIRPTADGGYILTGLSAAPQSNDVPRLIKLDAGLQTEWDRAYPLDPLPEKPYIFLTSPAIQNAVGGYAAAFKNDSTGTDFILTDGDGNLLAQKDIFPWCNRSTLVGNLPGGGYLVAREYSKLDLLHLDAGGNVTATYSLGSIAGRVIMLQNGDVLVAYKQSGKIIFRRTDVTGNLIWQTAPNDNLKWSDNLAPVLVALSDGGFAMLSYELQSGKNRVFRYDAQGNQTWISPADAVPGTMIPTFLAVTANGEYLLSGRTAASRGFIAQLSADGSSLAWSAESPEDGQEHLTSLNAIPTADGWGVGVGTTVGNKFGLVRVDSNSGVTVNYITGQVIKDNDENCAFSAGEPRMPSVGIWVNNGLEYFYAYSNGSGTYTVAVPAGTYTMQVNPNQPFFFVCPTADLSVTIPPGGNTTAVIDIPLQSLDPIHQITGTVRRDENDNCAADPNESPLEDWQVELNTGSYLLHTTTDADGNYSFFVPDGSYSAKLLPYNVNFGVCSPAVQTFNVSNPDPQTLTADFTASTAFDCALMRAELTRWNMRPCSTAKIRVHYRNIGTATAEDATVQVTLDPLLSFLDATLAPASIDGQVLTFSVGDVPPSPGSQWNIIDLYATVDCSAQIGDQLCLVARVTPDTVCYQSAEWPGAIVEVSGACENDEQAIFTISNIGGAPNAGQLGYTIIEDQIVLKTGDFQLNPGGTKLDTVPSNGLPLTIIADQEPGYPGDTSVTFTLYNCGSPNNNPPNGFGGPAGPFTWQECFAVTNSYDPNDKDATPQGFGPDHIVHPGTPLEYRIRFQNTGNDTAFLVVIRDTLSAALDFTAIEPRGSSHPYDFAQINDSIVQFSFYGIVLPDSAANQLESQGFVEFSIRPRMNLPLGTKVLNRAAIYFDNNPPVITNTVQRIYGKAMIVSIDDPADAAQLPVLVYPNPFVTETTFELPETAAGNYRLELLNASGRLLATRIFEGTQCRLERAGLPAGALLWAITREGNVVASGKIVAR